MPVVNGPISFKSQQEVETQEETREALTITQKLFETLECDKDTAYESFVIKH